LFEVTFVGNKNDWNVVFVFDEFDFVVKPAGFLEREAGEDGVYDHETIAGEHVGIGHSGEGFLAGGIQDVEHASDQVNFKLFSVTILNRRIIFSDKIVFNQLDGER